MPEENVPVEQPTPVVFDEPQAPEPTPQEPEAEKKAEEAQSQEAKPEEEQGEGQPRDEKGKFKSPAQTRIDELTRARREAEREAAYWRSRANPEKAPEPQAAKPEVKNFEDYDKYVEALADWKADQKVSEALKARDAEAAKTAEQRAHEANISAFQERLNQAKSSMPDFDEVVGKAEVNVAQHVSDAVIASQKCGELMYHLAKHPEIAERLNQMGVREADREIGRIEASLGQEKAQPVTKPVSKAPAPMRPAGSGASTSVTNDPEKMSHDEYRAWRKSQGARWA